MCVALRSWKNDNVVKVYLKNSPFVGEQDNMHFSLINTRFKVMSECIFTVRAGFQCAAKWVLSDSSMRVSIIQYLVFASKFENIVASPTEWRPSSLSLICM